MLTKEIPSGWSSTNDLRNINKDKLISNPNMKPMKNPIHRHFTDEIKDVFERFGFALKDYYGKGGHNNIYRNKLFVFRITKLYLNLEDESKFDEDKHLNIKEKYEDEKTFLKFLRKKLCPNIYFLGNVKIMNTIHRYMIMENYEYTLKTFIEKKIYMKILQTSEYYKTQESIFDDIRDQIQKILGKITSMNYVYYDFTSRNIVLRENQDGHLEVKFIDCDSDLCRNQEWILQEDETQIKVIILMYLIILDSFLMIYSKVRIYENEITELTNDKNIVEEAKSLLLDYDNNMFSFIIMHYFNKEIGISPTEVEDFDSLRENRKEILVRFSYQKILNLLLLSGVVGSTRSY